MLATVFIIYLCLQPNQWLSRFRMCVQHSSQNVENMRQLSPEKRKMVPNFTSSRLMNNIIQKCVWYRDTFQAVDRHAVKETSWDIRQQILLSDCLFQRCRKISLRRWSGLQLHWITAASVRKVIHSDPWQMAVPVRPGGDRVLLGGQTSPTSQGHNLHQGTSPLGVCGRLIKATADL